MDIIQEVGAYAGFAAVIGLAVLSALYFSQARDVRRLREWAGRAPERAAEQGVPGQTVLPEQAAQEAARPAPSGAVRPIPAAKPASAAAAGAKPATAIGPAAKPPPATPPGAKPAPVAPGAKPAPVTPGAKPQPAPAAPKPEPGAPGAKPEPVAEPGSKPAPGVPVKPGQVAPVPAAASATPAAAAKAGPAAPSRPATPPPVPARPPGVSPRPGPVGRSPSPAGSQSTAVLPASAHLRGPSRPTPSRRKGLAARHVALIVAGVIVLGAGAAFGVSQLGGDDTPATNEPAPGGADRQAPINPTTVTVSVLNGTTVPGLAAQIGDEVESAGFQRGNVANAIDQQRTASVVLYAEGADREGRLVARRLGIEQVEPIDPDSQALAGNASVVVIVGSDQTQ